MTPSRESESDRATHGDGGGGGAPLRVGIVGAGGIVRQRHLPGLRGIPGVRITAVCNRSHASTERFLAEAGIEAAVVDGWENLVARDDVDVVWIGAWPDLHAPVTCAALASGRHVFCQARMARDLAEAESMWEASLRHSDRIAALCPAPQGLRLGRAVQRLIAEEGRLGHPLTLRLWSLRGDFLDPAEPLHWRQDAGISGIQVLTLGIYVEVLQRWFGPIDRVAARGGIVTARRPGGDVSVPDHLHVLCRFDSGLEGSLAFSGVAAHPPRDGLEVHGSEGTLLCDFGRDELRFGARGAPGTEPVAVPEPPGSGWTVERDFISAVRDPAAPRPAPDFAEGLAYMRVVQAVHEALASGATVRV